MLRAPIAAAVLFVLPAGLAHAQVTGSIPGTGGFDDQQFYWNVMPSYEHRETQEQREIERRYRETVSSRIPDRKGSNDPWRSVRTAPVAIPDRHRVE